MKFGTQLSSLTLAICAVFLSGNAMAAKQATASVSNISFRLIDLNENDGITPDLQLADGNTFEAYRFDDYLTGENGYYFGHTNENDAYAGSYSTTVGTSQSLSTGGYSANLQVNTHLFDSPNPTETHHNLSNSTRFVLSAHTGLEISFDSSMTMNRSSDSHWDIGNYSQASIQVYDYWLTQNVDIGSFGNVDGNSPSSLSDIRHNVLRFDNNGDGNMDGGIIAKTMTTLSDSGATAPVPEPETYAMMLGGLALVGVVARRRKQK